jgi:hypothetical protein
MDLTIFIKLAYIFHELYEIHEEGELVSFCNEFFHVCHTQTFLIN